MLNVYHICVACQITEKGSNFSVGQRQLLCLARVLLKQRQKIVVLDEASANIDTEADALLQETIHTEFVQSTVLCIAHRLHTIAFYDKVVVLDAGRVVEYDTPLTLLLSPESHFKDMCRKTGDHDLLLQLAREQRTSTTTAKSA